MGIQRLKKIESVIIELVWITLTEQIKEIESDFGLINITWVKVSSDFSYLDIYVSSLKNTENLTKTLATFAPIIHRLLAQKLSLRKLPKARFRYDDAWKTAQDITLTINNL